MPEEKSVTIKFAEKDGSGEKAIQDQDEKNLPGRPPDGGWGWVIVLGGGFALSIAMGFNKSVALVYQALLERFQQSAAATAWVTSLTGMIRMMSSPLVSSLCNRFTHRKVAVAAGIITASSYILSAFPPNLPYLYVTLGLMQGIGVNMFIVPSLSMVAIYFDSNKGKAMSMITSSFGLGALYMAPVLRVLFAEYGYSGTLLILGGLVLHFSAAGLLYRPLPMRIKFINIPLESHPIEKELGQDEKLPIGNLDKQSTRPLNQKQKSRKISAQEPLLGEEVSAPSAEFNGTRTSVDFSPKSQDTMTSNPCLRFVRAIKRTLKFVCRELGFNMLLDLQFLLLGLTMSSIAWSMTNSWTLAAGLAQEKGFTSSQITVLLVVIAAAEFPCRIGSGVFVDLRPVRRFRTIIFAVIAFIVGVANASLAVVPGVIPTFIVWSVMMGLLGSCNSQYPTVISDLVPRSQVTSGLGLIRLLQGIGALLGPVMGGLFRDITGTYIYGFFAGGVQLVVFSILFGIRSYFILRNAPNDLKK